MNDDIQCIYKNGRAYRVGAVIAAAGGGERMRYAAPDGSHVKKQYMELGGVPILEWSVRAFLMSGYIAEVVLVVPPGDIEYCGQIISQMGGGNQFMPPRDIIISGQTCKKYMGIKPLTVVGGGATRQESVEAGAAAVSRGCGYIAVHDGARPFVDGQVIRKSVEAAARAGAACVAVRVTDTIKRADGPYIGSTPDRAYLWAAQTPQTFRRELLLEALDRARRDGFTATDDASLVERLGARVEIIEGSYDNIKITTPGDLAAAGAIASRYI